MAKKPVTIDEYLAGLDATNRAALQKVRRAIRAAAPGAEECISYGMPAFRLNGKLIAGFRAAANHCSNVGSAPPTQAQYWRAFFSPTQVTGASSGTFSR